MLPAFAFALRRSFHRAPCAIDPTDLCRNFRIQNQLRTNVSVRTKLLLGMDLLMCTEVLYKDHQDDDLGLGGLRSLPDPALLADQRVLENVLHGDGGHELHVIDYFAQGIQKQIKPHMRKIVTDWMLEVTEEEKCNPEVFSLAVNYLDRVLSRVSIAKHQFQLLASVCIFLASKFKESSPLCAEKLVICSDFSFTTDEIMRWELMVLELLNWDLSAITPYCILDQLLRRLVQPLHGLRDHFEDLQSLRMCAETLLNLAITEKEFLTVPPRLIAVSSLITAMSSLNRKPRAASPPEVTDFLQNLFELTNVDIDQLAMVITQLENQVRARIVTEQRKEAYPNNSTIIPNMKTTTCVC